MPARRLDPTSRTTRPPTRRGGLRKQTTKGEKLIHICLMFQTVSVFLYGFGCGCWQGARRHGSAMTGICCNTTEQAHLRQAPAYLTLFTVFRSYSGPSDSRFTENRHPNDPMKRISRPDFAKRWSERAAVLFGVKEGGHGVAHVAEV